MIDINRIRLDFPILHKQINNKPLVYLDNAATTQKPQQVIDKIIEFYTSYNSNIHRGVHSLSIQSSELYEQSREKVRSFINAQKVQEVVFTHGTTDALNLLSYSFGKSFISEGDEIIISEMEHHSNIIPWQVLCDEKNAILKIIPFNDDGVLDIDQFKSLINKKTKIISLTYVSNVLGTVNPIKDIIGIAHANDIPIIIDGAQAIQHFPIDVQELDCDFFVFSGHKVYAGTGIGVLYGKEKWLEKLPPYQTGGGMIDRVSFLKTDFTSLPLKFEAGTVNYVDAIGLSCALDYLDDIGVDHLYKHEQDLFQYTLTLLNKIEGLTIYGNAFNRSGAISFNLKKLHPYDVGMILDKLGIAIRTGTHCAEPIMQHYKITGTIRASFGLYNTKDEIDSLYNGLVKAIELLS